MPHILYDPQTSGGLLISVAPGSADALASALRETGHEAAAVIGEIEGGPAVAPVERIRVVPRP
jgi:selenide,water dikinase